MNPAAIFWHYETVVRLRVSLVQGWTLRHTQRGTHGA